MDKMIMTLFARTPVHVGAGNSVGAVDAPIQRERHTRIPIIPGSSLKGVLADLFNDENHQRTADGKWLFGQDDQNKDAAAGALLIGEARVVAFPVRSAKGMFAWITCPLALRRFKRETGATFDVDDIPAETAQATDHVSIKGQIVLEEYNFTVTAPPPQDVIDALTPLVPADEVWSGIARQLVIVPDDIFMHFCERACEVVTRIKIDDMTGTVSDGALFNQEQVPSETLFYTVIMAEKENGKKENARTAAEALKTVKDQVEQIGWLQIGGDATIGLGFCSAHCQEVK